MDDPFKIRCHDGRSGPAVRLTRPQDRGWNMLHHTLFSCLAAVVFAAAQATPLVAADPYQPLPAGNQHRLFTADAPAGVIGNARVMGPGPIAGYFQPVAFSGPAGVGFSLAQAGAFLPSDEHLQAGLMVGNVYRFQITGLPDAAGAELFPTVEIIDRTYPPPGLATLYPIPIELDEADLQAALNGEFVIRVVYLEDPQTAIPEVATPPVALLTDIAETDDALAVADRLGRPVAIVRIGSLAPPVNEALLPQFFFGHPAWAPIYQPEQAAQQ